MPRTRTGRPGARASACSIPAAAAMRRATDRTRSMGAQRLPGHAWLHGAVRVCAARKNAVWGRPWVNLRVGLQYTGYLRFNGGRSNYDGFGRSASQNNSLFLFSWMAF